MRKILYTTKADLSLPYFPDWEVHFYDEEPAQSGDLVYFRDPFNDPENYQPSSAEFNQLISQHQGAQIVDQITSFEQLYELEDKFFQAQRFRELSPRTWLPSEHEFIPHQTLAKPRVSQRAKNILFDLDGRHLDDSWIIQALLDIQEELRVYVVNGQILSQASIKSSKAHGPVKVIGVRELTANEQDFIQQAYDRCQLDFVGFDLAVLPNQELKIIEANRSPQFRRYAEYTGINLANMID